MPKYMVTVSQVFRRSATLFVEAEDEIEVTDKVERIPDGDFKWSDLDSDDINIEDVIEESAYRARKGKRG